MTSGHGLRWDGPGLEAWEAWDPWQAAGHLGGCAADWCVVAGWAVDLALGRVTREHSDLEIAVYHPHLRAIRRHLAGYVFHSVGDGTVIRLAADEDAVADHFQHWVLDPGAGRWRVDVMLDPGDAATWVYRRDRTLTAPRSFMWGRTSDGIRYLRPHGALLFKARHLRSKDQVDFDNCLGAMSGAERAWLADALSRLHPGHAWVARLEAGPRAGQGTS